MNIGILTSIYNDLPLEQTLQKLHARGVRHAEIPAGGVLEKHHCDPDELLSDASKLDAFREKFQTYDITIDALSCHVNPIHPVAETARENVRQLRQAVLLAEALGVPVVNTFSGCAGEPGGKYPNWIVQPWPFDFLELADWQWNEVLIPFWRSFMPFAQEHRVKIALEMHPGFMCYNPETLLRLCNAVQNPFLGCNFDPSNLAWQGADMPAAVRALSGRIFHCHAKDVALIEENARINGRLDAKHYVHAQSKRQWLFRTVGRGHGEDFWIELVRALFVSGYDGVLSIEHEDPFLSADDGIDAAVAFLRKVLAEA